MEIIVAFGIFSAIANVFMLIILRDIIHLNEEEVEHWKKAAELWQKSAEKWRTDYDKISQNIMQERNTLFNKLIEKSKSESNENC